MPTDRVFGIHAVTALLAARPTDVRLLKLLKDRRDERLNELEALAQNLRIDIERLPRKALDELVVGAHQGVVAEMDRGEATWDENRLMAKLRRIDHSPLLLVLDGITDPHNLGACLRSADAAGVDAVIVPRDKSADITPVARKVACGAAEAMPFVRVTNLARTLEKLQREGVWLFGAAGEAEKSIYESDLLGPVALVMGAEGKGLRRLTREKCDQLIKLPMAGTVSSLNVSVATGICLFEIMRQRISST
jgi:23S rRNA (guanosine2251-2'-O)-methyltransferase